MPELSRSGRRMVVRAGRLSGRLDVRSLGVGLILVLAAALAAMVALAVGDYPIAPVDVARTLLGHGVAADEFVIGSLRAPRVVVGLAAGACFGAAGAIFQSLTRNPLGSPDVIGFTQGAAAGAVLAIVTTGATTVAVTAPGALAGGAGTAALVYLLTLTRRGGGGGGDQGYRLVLVGIAISALAAAATQYLLLRAELAQAIAANVWTIGTLNGRGWSEALLAAGGLLVLLPLLVAVDRPLRTLELGEDTATALGVHLGRRRASALLLGVALTALATCVAGPVTFVALAAPQLARGLTRSGGPGVLPAAVMGAVLMIVSDIVAQRALAPVQLPVGVVTGLVGGLYLGWLLAAQWRRGRAGAG